MMDEEFKRRRCGARSAAGGWCTAYAVAGSEPARCEVHMDVGEPAARRRSRQCRAVRKDGERCRNRAVLGREDGLCASHAGLVRQAPTGERRCTGVNQAGLACRRWARVGSDPARCFNHAEDGGQRREKPAVRVCSAVTAQGKPCKQWARAGSEPALCAVHGGEPARASGERQCSATSANGERCRAWALRGSEPALCNMHAGGHLRPRAGRPRCMSATRAGAPCRRLAVRGSERRWGRPVCRAHAPKPARWAAPPPERRCTAVTIAGRQCKRWAAPGEEGAAAVCGRHAHPENSPNLRHGFYSRQTMLSEKEQAALDEARRSVRPLAGELFLARLKVRRIAAYLNQGRAGDAHTPLTPEELRAGSTTLQKALQHVERLVQAQADIEDARAGERGRGGKP